MSNGHNTNTLSFPVRFAKKLFERFPEWEEYVVKPSLKWQSESDLAIEIPSRFTPYCSLRIETMHDGIIVTWLHWHIHCDSSGGKDSGDQSIRRVLTIIQNLLLERSVIIMFCNNDTLSGGGLSPSRSLDKKLWRLSTVMTGYKGRLLAVSWNGSYDRGEFDPANFWHSIER